MYLVIVEKLLFQRDTLISISKIRKYIIFLITVSSSKESLAPYKSSLVSHFYGDYPLIVLMIHILTYNDDVFYAKHFRMQVQVV